MKQSIFKENYLRGSSRLVSLLFEDSAYTETLERILLVTANVYAQARCAQPLCQTFIWQWEVVILLHSWGCAKFYPNNDGNQSCHT